MQKYDVTLKLLLRKSAGTLLRALAGRTVVEWLNIELPEFRLRRVDLLCRLSDGSILHIELQSANDPEMAVRMAEYALAIYRRFGQFPRQIVLYVGRPAMRMPTALEASHFSFSYEARDLRELDGDSLLASGDVGDNVLAVLARLPNRKAAVQQIVRRIAGLKGPGREAAVRQLIVLAGLRGLEDLVEKEIGKVPIFIDIMENKVLGREFKKGIAVGEERGEARGEARGKAKGVAEGKAKGKAEGIQTGELRILRRLILQRFGSVPSSIDKRIRNKTPEELETLSLRLLDARSVDELLQ